jgi:hypothetical protein
MADREKAVKEGRIMSTRRFLTSQFTHAAGQNRPYSTRARKVDLQRTTHRWSKGDSNFWSHLQREQPYAECFCARLHRLRPF